MNERLTKNVETPPTPADVLKGKAKREVKPAPQYEPLDPEQDKIDQMLEASGQNPTLLGS